MTAAPAAADWPPGWRVERRGAVVSTMDEAQDLAVAGAPDRTVVVAETQTGGRGRQVRGWASPPGNLYLTMLLRPQVGAAQAAELTFIAALSLAESLDSVLDSSRVTLKWPNDVLLDGRKVSGILLQSSLGRGGQVESIVIGMGLNLVSHPPDATYPATDLATAGAPMTVETALAGLLGRMDHHYRRWRADGFTEIRSHWLARAHGLGDPIAVRLDTDRVDGVFAGLDASGALEVIRPDGSLCCITAGDVLDGRAGGIH